MLPIQLYRTLLWCYPAPFRREFGAQMVRAFAEQVRDARREGGRQAEAGVWLHTVFDLFSTAYEEHLHVIRQDLRYTFRTLAANPGFAAVAIVSLALGIGANTAIFSLLNGILMRPLPVSNPQELVMLTDPGSKGVMVGTEDNDRSLLTYHECEQLRRHSTMFSDLMASQSAMDKLPVRVNGGEPEEIRSRMVSMNYFRTLGVPALLGQTFDADAPSDAAYPYAVISYEYWQRRFAGRSDVLGARMAIRGALFSIIGVAPPSFFGETVGERPDAWLPLNMQPAVLPGRDWLHDKSGDIEKLEWLHAFARLKPGVSLEKAQAASNVLFQQTLTSAYGSELTADARKTFQSQRLKLRPGATGASELRGEFAEPLMMLLGAAGMVLLIACANLANLLLARATARTREISVRLALGASRGRLIRQLLTESMTVAVAGGFAGLAAAYVMRSGLLRLASDSIALPAAPDARVLGFAFALTLAAGLILGLLPAWRITKVNASAGLKEQGRGLTGSAAWLRVGKFVVVGQIALSLPLVVGAGLLVRTLFNLQRVDLGYAKENLLVVRVDAQTAGYQESRRSALFDELSQAMRRVPGVRAVSYSENGLFAGHDSSDQVDVEGHIRKGKKDRGSRYDAVGPGYFSALGIPILRGREISQQDQPSAARVCVINEAFAKLFFEGRNPLGMHVTQRYGTQHNTFEVVGVARDSRASRLRGDIESRFYVPVAQPVEAADAVTFEIRTGVDPSGVIQAVRRNILAIDPNLPIVSARPLQAVLDERTAQDRLLARLSIAFGVVALLLAAIGLYGVLSYGIARRTGEIGIRKALGAQHSAVIGMILGETGVLLAIGLGCGVAVAAGAMRLITSRLYGLAPSDPLAFAVAIAVLAGVALVAGWIPAYRASRVDPLIALRHE